MDNPKNEACEAQDIENKVADDEQKPPKDASVLSDKESAEEIEEDSNFWNIVLAAIIILIVIKGKTMTAVVVLAMIAIIATIHEFGHYLAAKAVGVRVDEFAVGMGSTKLWAKQIGETEYSIRPIPLGAFVKPAGMDPDEEFDPENDPGDRSFNNKSLPAKLAILFGGPVANVFLTFILSASLLFLVGERPSTLLVKNLIKGKPAHAAGIKAGDIIRTIEDEKIVSYLGGIAKIGEYPNKTISLGISRPFLVEGSDETMYKELTISVVPLPDDYGQGKIGILADRFFLQEDHIRKPFGEAVLLGLQQTILYGYKTYEAALGMFRRIFTKLDMPDEMGGPVKIASTIGDAMEHGFSIEIFTHYVAWLSLSIGVFNLIPIPALDGGRILLLLVGFFLSIIYKIIGKEIPEEGIISPNIEEMVHIAGFIFLILLLIAVTGKDLKEYFFPPTQLERLNLKEEDLIDEKAQKLQKAVSGDTKSADVDSSDDPNSVENHLDDPGRADSDAPADSDAYYGNVPVKPSDTTEGK